MLARENLSRCHDGDLDTSVISSMREILLCVSRQDFSFVDITRVIFLRGNYYVYRRYECYYRLSCPDITLKQSSHSMGLFHIFENLEEDDLLLIGEREGYSRDDFFYKIWIQQYFGCESLTRISSCVFLLDSYELKSEKFSISEFTFCAFKILYRTREVYIANIRIF